MEPSQMMHLLPSTIMQKIRKFEWLISNKTAKTHFFYT